VHRDIKPENILLCPEESKSNEDIQVKLTDFGFATFFKKEQGLKQVLGSPLYMAPEIVQEQSYNSKVDIWSVGVIAHIMISGCPPFFGKSKMEIY
jgi:calcium-dependent protein kinase